MHLTAGKACGLIRLRHALKENLQEESFGKGLVMNRKVVHEIKLEKSVKILLAVIAVTLLANLIEPAARIDEALAQAVRCGEAGNPCFVSITTQHSDYISVKNIQ